MALDHWPQHIHDFRQTSELLALQLAESRSQAKDSWDTARVLCCVGSSAVHVLHAPTVTFSASIVAVLSFKRRDLTLDVGYINQKTVILLALIARNFPASSSIISCPETASLHQQTVDRGSIRSSRIAKRRYVLERNDMGSQFLLGLADLIASLQSGKLLQEFGCLARNLDLPLLDLSTSLRRGSPDNIRSITQSLQQSSFSACYHEFTHHCALVDIESNTALSLLPKMINILSRPSPSRCSWEMDTIRMGISGYQPPEGEILATEVHESPHVVPTVSVESGIESIFVSDRYHHSSLSVVRILRARGVVGENERLFGTQLSERIIYYRCGGSATLRGRIHGQYLMR
ncbi:hypothetical protein F5146DRAFT_1201738 [Armillaria mellea]|nr:hypothetical protein F5146DRAFT_1201738 [Armillaria mellea]